MVGVNSYTHQFGTVAIFATLFAAILVNGDKGCVLDFEHSSDFDLDCNNLKNVWAVNDDAKVSPKKILGLSADQEGCLKTKNTVVLNSTSTVSVRYYRDSDNNEKGKFVIRLIPKEGDCSDEECMWDVSSDSNDKPGEWISAEHKFPLKSMKEYYVQINVGKSKGKLFLDHITVPSALGDSSNCQSVEGSVRAASKAGMKNNISGPLVATGSNESEHSHCPNLVEFSKNLMLTSASVLTLNNLLN